jgi:choline kinase
MPDLLVLGAGVGSRLGLGDLPKWLAPIGGSTPAQVQLAGAAAVGLERRYVVAGFAIEGMREVASARDVTVIENPRHREWNNWYSLLVGLDVWLADGGDAVWVVNSDVFAAPSWFERVFAAAPLASAALVVDRERPLTDEAMKVAVQGGAVRQIGKTDVSQPCGEYVGVTWLTAATARALRDVLAGFRDDAACAQHWYEHAVQRHVERGGTYATIDVPDGAWVEVDAPHELLLAAALVQDAEA